LAPEDGTANKKAHIKTEPMTSYHQGGELKLGEGWKRKALKLESLCLLAELMGGKKSRSGIGTHTEHKVRLFRVIKKGTNPYRRGGRRSVRK